MCLCHAVPPYVLTTEYVKILFVVPDYVKVLTMVYVSSQEANLTAYCLGAGGGECLDVQVCGRVC